MAASAAATGLHVEFFVHPGSHPVLTLDRTTTVGCVVSMLAEKLDWDPKTVLLMKNGELSHSSEHMTLEEMFPAGTRIPLRVWVIRNTPIFVTVSDDPQIGLPKLYFKITPTVR